MKSRKQVSLVGPNQNLEEIRPAVTTSPETRRSGGRSAAATSNFSRDARAHADAASACIVAQRASTIVAAAVHSLRPASDQRNDLRTSIDRRAPAGCATSARASTAQRTIFHGTSCDIATSSARQRPAVMREGGAPPCSTNSATIALDRASIARPARKSMHEQEQFSGEEGGGEHGGGGDGLREERRGGACFRVRVLESSVKSMVSTDFVGGQLLFEFQSLLVLFIGRLAFNFRHQFSYLEYFPAFRSLFLRTLEHCSAVSFSGGFPSFPVVVLLVRGSFGLLSRSLIDYYHSWGLWLARARSRSYCLGRAFAVSSAGCSSEVLYLRYGSELDVAGNWLHGGSKVVWKWLREESRLDLGLKGQSRVARVRPRASFGSVCGLGRVLESREVGWCEVKSDG
ncbi:hypothetical protein F511_24575 [Dorcoceras hygrometricum]|uniref:Uncharacterized protein n=1 Tax=Dorcoceras hygrometricum TaxID=472368 RepID=A0A2Z7BE91_9LAMI|nr:hypothetical protein F511_24575 [Dorcoceras hygrometricum]